MDRRRFLLTGAAAAVPGQGGAQPADSSPLPSLFENFRKPPVEARPRAFWCWVNGNTDLAEITRELEEAHAKGMGGFDIWDVTYVQDEQKIVPAGPRFMGPESVKAIAHTIREAGRLGLDIGIIVSSGWNAGGDWVRPEHQTMGLFRSRRAVEGPGLQKLDLPFPDLPKDTGGKRPRPTFIPRGGDGLPHYWRDLAVLAMPEGSRAGEPIAADQLIDLTGKSTWTAPPGRWIVARYVCTNTGQPMLSSSDNSAGPMIDHFNPEATEAHLEHFIRLLSAELGPLKGTALRYLYTDSYEVQGDLWTPKLGPEFMARFGYSIIPFLPAFDGRVVSSAEATARFREDYARLLSDLIIESHYMKGVEVCHRHGLQFAAEAAGPGQPIHNCPFESLRSSGVLDIPRGEFWHRYTNPNHPPDTVQIIKGPASAAHLYNRKFVEAEAFTSIYLWQEGPADLKSDADRAFCEGLNRIVYHTFPHTPAKFGRPGFVYGFGTQISEELPWWPLSKPWHDYLARVGYMLQQGHFVADVLYYYGEKSPNFAAPKTVNPEMAPGYDYDVLNADILLKLEVRNGRLVLPHGVSYALLVLAEEQAMSPEIVEKIGRLAAAGAAIITGPPPVRAHGWKDHEARDGRVHELAAGIWPKLIPAKARQPRQVLFEKGIAPDFQAPAKAPLDWIHRRLAGGVEIYFVRNTSKEAYRQAVRLRIPTGSTVEAWNPVTLESTWVGTGPAVTVELPAYGSMFYVARRGRAAAAGRPSAKAATPRPIDGPWKIEFENGPNVTVQRLASWHESSDEAVRHFAGVARYRTSFEVPAAAIEQGAPLWIDLGRVELLARVWVNGREAGAAWTHPFRVNAAEFVRPGRNELIVEVANSWPNALIGDARRPAAERRYRSNITRLPTGWTHELSSLPSEQYGLRPSGLLGPVTWVGSGGR